MTIRQAPDARGRRIIWRRAADDPPRQNCAVPLRPARCRSIRRAKPKGLSMLIVFLLAVHILSALFWVGGMAFAHGILRPAAMSLEPPVRLPLWRGVFERFLPRVGGSIVALLVSGYW